MSFFFFSIQRLGLIPIEARWGCLQRLSETILKVCKDWLWIVLCKRNGALMCCEKKGKLTEVREMFIGCILEKWSRRRWVLFESGGFYETSLCN